MEGIKTTVLASLVVEYMLNIQHVDSPYLHNLLSACLLMKEKSKN